VTWYSYRLPSPQPWPRVIAPRPNVSQQRDDPRITVWIRFTAPKPHWVAASPQHAGTSGRYPLKG